MDSELWQKKGHQIRSNSNTGLKTLAEKKVTKSAVI